MSAARVVAAASSAAKVAVPDNRLYIGDCLPVLAEMAAAHGEFADLVYLDPPFNSSRLYNHAFKGRKRALPQKAAFHDTWKWTEATRKDFHEFTEAEAPETPAAALLHGMRTVLEKRDESTLAYLTYMTRRLARVRAVMRPSASVYLHCDQTAGHYLKLAMDAVFGPANFINDIVWSYRRWSGRTRGFQRMHDNLLFYAKSRGAHAWNWPMEAKAVGTASFKRWNEWDADKGKMVTRSDKSVRVAETGMRDVWDISRLQSTSKERLGYMTQKPLALLKRVVAASSNSGDLVLDPFCGCGTTIAACHELGRRFICVDAARSAAQVIVRRMQSRPGFGRLVVGDKTPKNVRGWGKLLPDADEHGEVPAWARFQYDAIAAIPKAEQIEGPIQRTARQGADGGIDGLIHLEHPKTRTRSSIVIQVKRKKRPTVGDVADTLLAVENNSAFMGLLITLHPPTPDMRARAESGRNRFGGKYYPKVAILTYEEVKAGKFAEKIPYEYAVDPDGGRQDALDMSDGELKS